MMSDLSHMPRFGALNNVTMPRARSCQRVNVTGRILLVLQRDQMLHSNHSLMIDSQGGTYTEKEDLVSLDD